MIDIELQQILSGNNYTHAKELPDGRVAAIMHLLYTRAIVTLHPDTWRTCYEDRWCYSDLAKAAQALAEWDGTGEPQGWHKHPDTGRRREDGKPEYVLR